MTLPPPAGRDVGIADSVQPEGAAGGVDDQLTVVLAVPLNEAVSVPVTLYVHGPTGMPGAGVVPVAPAPLTAGQPPPVALIQFENVMAPVPPEQLAVIVTA